MRIAVVSSTTIPATLPDDPHYFTTYGSEVYNCYLVEGLAQKGHEIEWWAPIKSSTFSDISNIHYHPIIDSKGAHLQNELLENISLDHSKTTDILECDFLIDMSKQAHVSEELALYHNFKRYCNYRSGYRDWIYPMRCEPHFVTHCNYFKLKFEVMGFQANVCRFGIPDFCCPLQDNEKIWETNLIPIEINDGNYFLYPHRPNVEKGLNLLIKLARDFPNETFVISTAAVFEDHKREMARVKQEYKDISNIKFIDIPQNKKYHYYRRALMRNCKAVLSLFQEQNGYMDTGGLISAEAVKCLPKDSLIPTTNGMTLIQNIDVDDITYRGDKVLEKFENEYNGELISIKGRGMIPVNFTPEHPVLIFRDNEEIFKPATDITLSDRLVIRRTPAVPRPRFFLVVNRRKYRHYGTLTRTYVLDENIAYLLGWFIAEGWVHHNQVGLAMGKDDIEYVQGIKDIMLNYFSCEASEYTRRSVTSITFNHNGLADFLKMCCGTGAKNKHVPPFLFGCDEQIVTAFFAGYLMGDGHYEMRRGRFRANTVSRSLAFGLQLLAASAGLFINIAMRDAQPHIFEGRLLQGSDRYELSFPKKFSDKIWTSEFVNRFRRIYRRDLSPNLNPIRTNNNPHFPIVTERAIYVHISAIKGEPYSGPVYNIRTTSGTYDVPFVVHNCGAPVIVSRSPGSEELFGELEDKGVTFVDGYESAKMAIRYKAYETRPNPGPDFMPVHSYVEDYERVIKKYS